MPWWNVRVSGGRLWESGDVLSGDFRWENGVMNDDSRWENNFRWENDMINGDSSWENGVMNDNSRWENDMMSGDFRWEKDMVIQVREWCDDWWFQVREYDEWWFQVREGYDKWWFQVREWYVMNGDFRWENDMWWMVISGENGVINDDFRRENELCDEWFQVRMVWWMVTLGERMMWCLVILGERIIWQLVISGENDVHRRLERIKDLLGTLPRSIFVVMRYLFAFLNQSVAQSFGVLVPFMVLTVEMLLQCFSPQWKLPSPQTLFQKKYWLRGKCSNAFFHTFHKCVICEVNFCWDIITVRATDVPSGRDIDVVCLSQTNSWF